MTTLILRKDLGCLRPTDEAGEEALRKVKLGALVKVEFTGKPRNVMHHRKFFAMLNLIYQNQKHYRSVDHILAAMKFALGYTEKVRTKRGEIEVPLSISFAAMDQDEFDAFYNRAVDFVLAEVVPGLDRADLERELMEFAQ
jgi:hypothetical protein